MNGVVDGGIDRAAESHHAKMVEFADVRRCITNNNYYIPLDVAVMSVPSRHDHH